MKQLPLLVFGVAVLGSGSLLSGCDRIAKKATETAIETATGNAVSVDGEKVEIKTADGKTAVISNDGKAVTIKSDEGQAVYKQEEGKVTIDGPDGKVVMVEGSDGALPKELPIPLPEKTTVIRSGTMDSEKGGKMITASLKSESDAATLGAFYQKHLEADGFKVKRTETNAGGMSMVLVAAEKGTVQVGAQIMSGTGEPGSMVNLSWVEKK